MEPVGTLRVRPSSARTAPYDLHSSRMSMTTSATSPSRVVHAGELALDEPPDLVVGQPVAAEALDRLGHQPLRGAQGRRRGSVGAGVCRDERSGTLAQLDDPFVFE